MIIIKTSYIKLDQFMKLSNLCGSGGEAKEMILSGKIEVNGEKELRRGRKLKGGDKVNFEKNIYEIRQDGGLNGDKENSS